MISLGRAVQWTLGAAQAAVELVRAGRRFMGEAGRGLLPLDEDEPPMPLSHLDSERQAEFARRAGHESRTLPKLPPRR